MKLVSGMVVLVSCLVVSLAATAQAKHTPFDPAKHGFNFGNDFQNDVKLPAGMDIRTGGLCGGFAYASLDYFLGNRPIPRQNYRPADNTPLQQYLMAREVTSLVSNADKWAEISVNPGGARDSEFFNWGLQGTNGGRIEELKSFIDRGMPVPLGLKADKGGDHQVLAIGYDMGRYRGDLGAFESDFKIFIYDSNHPNRTMTLVPDVANKVYRYPTGDADGDTNTWRTYFVDKNYHAQAPPNIGTPNYPNDGLAHELLLRFATGSDDMRGGNDNLDLTINIFDGSQQHFPAVNLRARWVSNYTQFARIVLNPPVPQAQIKDLTLSDTFGGGISGDNWDMSKLDVNLGPEWGNVIKTVGFHRFTGSDKVLMVPLNSAPPAVAGQVSRLLLEIRTGSDDMRGGNDNLNIETHFADGRTQIDNNVNNSAKWNNNTTHTVTIVLNKPVPVNQIRSLTLATTFSGGMGGDNWNMDSLKVTATGVGVNQVIATSGFNRFTGGKKTLNVATH
ncbi:MAG TPA: hypothetical protein VF860_11235 [Candidatus Acidoferrales bacterium]